MNGDTDLVDPIVMAFQNGSSVDLLSGNDVTGPLEQDFVFPAINDAEVCAAQEVCAARRCLSRTVSSSSRPARTSATQSKVTIANLTPSGGTPDAGAGFGHATPDGRFVVFTSAATNLVSPSPTAATHVYLHDRDADADGILDDSVRR